MRKLSIFLLIGGILPVSGVHADGSLQGLEMDVMESGESPAQATARIALPGSSATVAVGKPDDGDLVAGRAQPGSNGGQAPALEEASTMAPASASASTRESGAEISDNLGAGPADATDGGAVAGVDGDVAQEPVAPGVMDGGPGDVGIIEGPIEVPIGEPPVDDRPVEIPIGELPGGDTPIDETPIDETPIEDVDGDPTGGGVVGGEPGDGGGVEPLPVEIPGDPGGEIATGSARADRS